MERNSEKKLFLLLQRKISPFLAILTRYKLLYRPAKEMYILSLFFLWIRHFCCRLLSTCSNEWAGRAQRQEGEGIVVLLDVFFPLSNRKIWERERDGPCVTTTPLHLFSSKKKEHVRWALSYCTCLLGRASLVAKWLARSLHNTDHDPIESPWTFFSYKSQKKKKRERSHFVYIRREEEVVFF